MLNGMSKVANKTKTYELRIVLFINKYPEDVELMTELVVRSKHRKWLAELS